MGLSDLRQLLDRLGVSYRTVVEVAHLRNLAREGIASLSCQLSDFILGHNLGELLKSLDVVRAALRESSVRLTFPKVVVCGEESCGKSSVLERILTIPFFPRGSNITTRLPISLRMHHVGNEAELVSLCQSHERWKKSVSVDNIYVSISFDPELNEVGVVTLNARDDLAEYILDMQSKVLRRVNGSERSFVTDPLRVELWGTKIPDLELVDLPGIISGSLEGERTNVARVTREITRQYLADRNTIPVVIVRGDCPSVRNSAVFEVLQELKKTQTAICVLGCADLCARPQHNRADPYYQLKLRATGSAPDCPTLGGGYLAIKNRDTLDVRGGRCITLQEALIQEREFFQREMPELLESQNAGIESLLARIQDNLASFIRETWAPEARKQLQKAQGHIEGQLLALGDEPNDSMFPRLRSACVGLLRTVLATAKPKITFPPKPLNQQPSSPTAAFSECVAWDAHGVPAERRGCRCPEGLPFSDKERVRRAHPITR